MIVRVILPGTATDTEETIDMPEGPQLQDRIYDVCGRGVVIVRKRDWYPQGDEFQLTVWVQ